MKTGMAAGGKDRRRYSTGTDDPSAARLIAQKIWRALNSPETDRLNDLWKHYLADRRKDGRDVSRQEDAWNLGPFFGDRLGDDVDKDSCRQYATLRKRFGAAASTVRTELEYLRACLNLRYERGHNRVATDGQSSARSVSHSQFLGHTSTRITERTYARDSPSFMKDAAAALEF